MGGDKDMNGLGVGMKTTARLDITDEWLALRTARAAYCADATIPGDEFRAIYDLATRSKLFDLFGTEHLREVYHQDEVNLDGDDLRILLMLASQAKRGRLKPRLRVVPATASGRAPDSRGVRRHDC